MGSVCLRCFLEGFVASPKAKELVCRVQLVVPVEIRPQLKAGLSKLDRSIRLWGFWRDCSRGRRLV